MLDSPHMKSDRLTRTRACVLAALVIISSTIIGAPTPMTATTVLAAPQHEAEAAPEAEAEIAAASRKLQAEAEEARQRLSAEADMLGAAVAERILGRKAS